MIEIDLVILFMVMCQFNKRSRVILAFFNVLKETGATVIISK